MKRSEPGAPTRLLKQTVHGGRQIDEEIAHEEEPGKRGHSLVSGGGETLPKVKCECRDRKATRADEVCENRP